MLTTSVYIPRTVQWNIFFKSNEIYLTWETSLYQPQNMSYKSSPCMPGSVVKFNKAVHLCLMNWQCENCKKEEAEVGVPRKERHQAANFLKYSMSLKQCAGPINLPTATRYHNKSQSSVLPEKLSGQQRSLSGSVSAKVEEWPTGLITWVSTSKIPVLCLEHTGLCSSL